MRVECWGGPLDGLNFGSSLASLGFVWMSKSGRAYRQPREGMHLYRRMGRSGRVVMFGYAGHTHTICAACGVFTRKTPRRRCGLCNAVLVGEGAHDEG